LSFLINSSTRIGSYAHHQYGVAVAATKHFTRCNVTEKTAHSIRDVYQEDLKLWRRCGISEPIRERSVLLGKQLYVQKVKEDSAVMSFKSLRQLLVKKLEVVWGVLLDTGLTLF